MNERDFSAVTLFNRVVRHRTAIIAALAALLLSSSAQATLAPTGITGTTGPTLPPASQVQAALKGAESSAGLWATINICDTANHPNTVGIRAQMPALGFATSLQMVIKLGYYSTGSANFKPVPNSTVTLNLGQASVGYHQDGVNFMIKPPATLNASVKFIWRSGSTVLGSTTRTTSSGRKGVQQGDPAGYSTDVCRIT